VPGESGRLSATLKAMQFHFDAENILPQLEAASEEALDSLPFGIIRMAADTRVTAYNQYESNLSGLSPVNVKGRYFFTEVAPCTDNFMVAQKFQDCSELDEVIDYVFTFRMRPTRVKLRLLKSASAQNQYLLVSKTA
jgi:photoactive yellow protein